MKVARGKKPEIDNATSEECRCHLNESEEGEEEEENTKMISSSSPLLFSGQRTRFPT